MNTGVSLIEEMNSCVVPEGHAAFWWLGQHSFVVKLGGVVCYIDPFLTDMEARQVRPLLKPGEITNADIVLGSHDHADHIDREAWPVIATASPKAVFVTPALLRERMVREMSLPVDRVLGVDEGITVKIGEITVTGVPAAHELLARDPATGFHACIGFVIGGNGFRLYHAGDTCLYEGMQALLRRWPLDLAFLPINGRDAKRLAANCVGNMTYQEAADLAGAVLPGLTVPAHFEMFAGNCEDPQLFADYMEIKYPFLAFHLPMHGDCVLVPGGKGKMTRSK